MRRQRLRNRSLASIPLSAAVLALDLAVPGWGRFYNPLFFIRAQLAQLKRDWIDVGAISLTDQRLTSCATVLSHPHAITEAQAALRQSIIGENERFAITQLGVPACQLADDAYRWLIEDGLSLDITLSEAGEVDDARLSNQ